MVIVPTLLDERRAALEALLEHLEVLALGNIDPHIHFALLTDFADAPAAEMPGDDAHPGGGAPGHRGRSTRAPGRDAPAASTCSTACGAGTRARASWMGWERKRGKIEEFNRLLRGATDTSFAVQVGDPEILPGSATASRSTATRACRATRRGS